MAKQKEGEEVPKWRETPLDHWSKDVDPVIMTGDEWVENDTDPGNRVFKQKLESRPPAPFMHPMHDSGYERDDENERPSEHSSTRDEE